MNSKLHKVLDLLDQINEVFPDLEKIIINDPDNPDYIILATDEYLQQMVDIMGEEDFEQVAESYPSTKKKRNIQ